MKKSEDQLLQDMDRARTELSEHKISKSSTGRWLVKRPGTGVFWYEVVVLEGGHLLVHGDIEVVLFGTYHPAEGQSPDQAAINCVKWMASRKRPDDHYFIEKASIGTGADSRIWTPDDDVLSEEIEALLQYPREMEKDDEGEIDTVYQKRREDLEEALESVGSSSLEEVQRMVYDALDGDSESVPRGRRISTAMIYAHAALQRLAILLDEPELS